jgi:hypothetical protein
MFRKRKIQAAKARSDQPQTLARQLISGPIGGELAGTPLPPDKRPIPRTPKPLMKKGGSRGIAGALGSGVAKTMKGLPTKAISNALKTFAASKARTFKKGGMAVTSKVGKAVKRKTADVRGRAMKGK